MNAIVKATGLIVLIAAGYVAVSGSAVLAAPGPEEGPVHVLPVDPCLFGPCMQINPCLLGACVELDPCVSTPCNLIPPDNPQYEPTPTQTEEPTATPTETEEPTATPTETEQPTATPTDQPPDEPTATPSDEPACEPTDEPTDQPEAGGLPHAGTGDGAAAQGNQGVIAIAGLGLAGLAIAGALVLTLRRKQTR